MSEEFPIEVTIDASKAQQGASRVDEMLRGLDQGSIRTAKLMRDIGGSAGSVVDAMKDLAKEGRASLSSVANEASKTNAQLSKMMDVQHFEKFRGTLGDLRDAFDIVAGSLLGFSEAEAKAVSQSGALLEKGIAVGAAFGPWGALFGGLAGAVGGAALYITEMGKESDKTKLALDEIAGAARDANNEFSVMGASDLSGLLSQLSELQKKLNYTNGYSEETQNQMDALAKKGAQGLADAFDLVAAKASGDVFGTKGKSLEDLLTLYEAEQKLVNKYRGEALASAASLRLAEENDPSVGLLEEKNEQLKDLSSQLDSATAKSNAYKAAIDAYAVSTGKAVHVTRSAAKAMRELPAPMGMHSADIAADNIWDAKQRENRQLVGDFGGKFEIDPNVGDNLLGELERDVVRVTDKLKEMGVHLNPPGAQEAIDALSSSLALETEKLSELVKVQGLSNREREIESGVIAKIYDMKARGIQLSEEEISKVRDHVSEQQRLNDAIKKQTDLKKQQSEIVQMWERVSMQAIDAVHSGFEEMINSGERDWKRFFAMLFLDLAQIGLNTLVNDPAAGKGLGNLLGASVQHNGGMAGEGPTRHVSPYWFTGAPRYHNGGMAGLKPDEIPAILQRGERVLSRREMAQGGRRLNERRGPTVVKMVVQGVSDVDGFRHSMPQIVRRLRKLAGNG